MVSAYWVKTTTDEYVFSASVTSATSWLALLSSPVMLSRSWRNDLSSAISSSLTRRAKRMPSGTVFDRSASVTVWMVGHPTSGLIRSSLVAGGRKNPHETPAPGAEAPRPGEQAGPNIEAVTVICNACRIAPAFTSSARVSSASLLMPAPRPSTVVASVAVNRLS